MIRFTKMRYPGKAYASRVLWNIRGNLSSAVSARLLGESGSQPIDDQADPAVTSNLVSYLAEWIAACRHGVS